MNKRLDYLIVAAAALAAVFILFAAEASAGEKNKFQGALTVEQVVAARPHLAFIKEFTAMNQQPRWLFRYTSSIVPLLCPITVNVGPRPSLAEVDIATTAAICEAYAIDNWVKSLPKDKPADNGPKYYY